MGSLFTFIKTYSSFIFFVVIIILSLLLFKTYSTLKQEREDRNYEEKQKNQNILAFKDSITVEYNKKLKAWEFSKDNFVVQKISDLEAYNKQLADELKKVKGDVISAINTNVQSSNLGGISVSNDLAVYDTKTNYYGLKFKNEYKDSGFEQKIVGTSKFHVIPNELTKKWLITPETTVIDTNFTAIKITYGFKDLKNKYQVFAISASPKIQLSDLTGGYIIDKQPEAPPVPEKRWGIGPYLGYGLSAGSNLQPRFSWSIGFAAHYDILQFGFGNKNK